MCLDATSSQALSPQEDIDTDCDCEHQWEAIESKLLNGQKIQGILMAKQVYALLESCNPLHEFPLMCTIHEIVFSGCDIREIVQQGIAICDMHA